MNSLFEEPVEIIDHKPVLLDVQQSLLTRGREAYRNARRVVFQAPCGSGKTVVAAEQTRLALALGKSVLHIVHRRRLVDQMIGMLGKFGIHGSPIMEGRTRWRSDVYCASRDTLLAILKAGGALPITDLIVFDECHVLGSEVQKWCLTNNPGACWTGYTASPVYSNGQSMKPPWQGLVCMAPTSEMLRIGRLCPVKVYNPDAIGQRRRKGDKVKPVGDPVDHWKKFARGLPTVAYCATVAESQALVQRYVAAGITAEHIDASTPEEEREAVFDRSEKGITKVISNCGVLIEGVDLPWLCCCQLLRGCNSLVLWIQACGRIMRVFPGKDFGIVLDHAAAAHEFGLPDSDFKWTLEDEKANAKANKPPKDRRPVTCLKCGAVFVSKPACPECGHVLPRKRRKSILEQLKNGDGVLTEFTGEQSEHRRREILERAFKSAYYAARAKGGTMSMAAAVFKRMTGLPPWETDLSVNVPKFDEWKISAKHWRL